MLTNTAPSTEQVIDDNGLASEIHEEHLGRIVSVTGSQAIVHLFDDLTDVVNEHAPRCDMGTFVKIVTPTSKVIGLIAGLTVPVPSQNINEREIKIAELELVGELYFDHSCGRWKFRRGVSIYPTLEDRVYVANRKDLDDIFSSEDHASIRIGSVYQDESIEANVMIDGLLRKHFAVLGTTGCGKSCTVALILRSVLEKCPNAHIVLLDPHNEYSSTFGDMAEYINQDNLHLPYWLMTFEELSEVVLGADFKNSIEIDILRECVKQAKSTYGVRPMRSNIVDTGKIARSIGGPGVPTIDTPTPYKISDVLQILDNEMGRLEKAQNLGPYRTVKANLEHLINDPRFSFMFGSLTVQDDMAAVISRIFRIPVNNKPISIVDVSGVPSEVVNVVISVISRMAFDLALWSEKSFPLMLVCEEAHRYVPQDSSLGFEPTKRAIARIAKEGRKYGVSLCVVSQRPSELDPTILSQCNTVFAMRMTNEHDQDFVRAACSDSSLSLLDFLTTMGNSEVISFGEGVPFPMRILMDKLPQEFIPQRKDLDFHTNWADDVTDDKFLQSLVQRWRTGDRS